MKKPDKRCLITVGLVGVHFAISLVISLIARSSAMQELHIGQGLWLFAGDSSRYHSKALQLLELFDNGDFYGFFTSSHWWHTKWIALSYILFGSHPLSFAPINALAWTASIVCVYRLVLAIMPAGRHLAVVCAVIFGFWPSYLFHSTQLLKEVFVVLGVLLVIWGWIGLLTGQRRIVFVVYAFLGILLVSVNRDYITVWLTCLSLLAVFLVALHARRCLVHAVVAFVLILGTSSAYRAYYNTVTAQVLQKDLRIRKKNEGVNANVSWLTSKALVLSSIRTIFISRYQDSESHIDKHVTFGTPMDVVKYVPRALMVGYLAPFPSHWFVEGKNVKRVGRILAGFEMIGWYLLLIGSISFFANGQIPFHIRFWLLLYSITLILFTTMVLPNVGTLFRIRYVYLLPIMVGGVEGWSRYILIQNLIRMVKKNTIIFCIDKSI